MRKYLAVSIAMAFLIVSISAALSLSGCSSPKSKLVGKWAITDGKEVDKNVAMEFFSDNKVSAMVFLGSGSWSILDDGRVKLEIASVILTGKFEGDILQIF